MLFKTFQNITSMTWFVILEPHKWPWAAALFARQSSISGTTVTSPAPDEKVSSHTFTGNCHHMYLYANIDVWKQRSAVTYSCNTMFWWLLIHVSAVQSSCLKRLLHIVNGGHFYFLFYTHRLCSNKKNLEKQHHIWEHVNNSVRWAYQIIPFF